MKFFRVRIVLLSERDGNRLGLPCHPHSNYGGNYAPQIPRNVILRYFKEGDFIIDFMMGSGTTLIDAKLLNRRAIEYDINPEALKITKENLNFDGIFCINLLLR
ncbi:MULTISPECIES: DNA methyltransferase [unclassified Thermosipho (in: thermotogales)]|uniref:DNA methyltransferase n=1 Tax=unclassified Thermosipho (in: thermotogales) TaxID=2676525 RepID=UPI000950C240|nr:MULTISPECIES: DNA methyltransferase [unclassified Thermosipho (in: thermotogales)]